jgi:tRNA-intron endonuclease
MKPAKRPARFPIYLANKISSNSQKAITLQKTRKFGELKASHVVYSPYEALYLVEKGKAEFVLPVSLFSYKKAFSKARFIKRETRKDKEFLIKYIVFRDLRNKGYIVKTALKYGTEFRVYKKTDKHARWIVHPTPQSAKINWKEFISKNRIAHSISKKLLLAVVDSEENIIYYEVDWIKP